MGPHLCGRRGVGGIESLGGGVKVARVQVAVAVQRLRGQAVSEHRLDDLHRRVLPDRQGGRGVPKIMHAEALAEPGRRDRRTEVPPPGMVNPKSLGEWPVGEIHAELLGQAVGSGTGWRSPVLAGPMPGYTGALSRMPSPSSSPSSDGTAPAGLPVEHRGPQEPDQLAQAIFKAEATGGQCQQQPTQLVQLPALLGLGTGAQGLLKRLVDGVQRRIHDLFVEEPRQSPFRSSHPVAPQLATSCLHCLLTKTGVPPLWPSVPACRLRGLRAEPGPP